MGSRALLHNGVTWHQMGTISHETHHTRIMLGGPGHPACDSGSLAAQEKHATLQLLMMMSLWLMFHASSCHDAWLECIRTFSCQEGNSTLCMAEQEPTALTG